jgi:hypothetical protein
MQQPVLSAMLGIQAVLSTIMLDVPPDEMTFAHAIGQLRDVLTREFQGAMFGDVDSKGFHEKNHRR